MKGGNTQNAALNQALVWLHNTDRKYLYSQTRTFCFIYGAIIGCEYSHELIGPHSPTSWLPAPEDILLEGTAVRRAWALRAMAEVNADMVRWRLKASKTTAGTGEITGEVRATDQLGLRREEHILF